MNLIVQHHAYIMIMFTKEPKSCSNYIIARLHVSAQLC